MVNSTLASIINKTKVLEVGQITTEEEINTIKGVKEASIILEGNKTITWVDSKQRIMPVAVKILLINSGKIHDLKFDRVN